MSKYINTVGKKNEIDNMMSTVLILHKIFGHQLLDPNWTWRKYYVYQLMTLALFIYVFIGTLEILRNTSDFEVIAEACYTILLMVMATMKLFLFITKRATFQILYVSVKTTFLSFINENSSESIDVLMKMKRLVKAHFLMLMGPFVMYELTTLWNYVHGRKILMSRSTSTLMPLTTPYHEVGWLLHSIFMFELGFTTIMIDMWFVFLVFFLCQASDSLSNLLKVEAKGENENAVSYSRRLKGSLRKFYKAHVKEIEYFQILSGMYKWIFQIPITETYMRICILLLVLSKDMNLKFAPHILPIFGQFLYYCWFGEQFKTKATDIKTALLRFDWVGLQMIDRRSYYIMITFIQKHFGMKSAFGTDLSLITMTNVFKGSYQAFTVLQSVEN